MTTPGLRNTLVLIPSLARRIFTLATALLAVELVASALGKKIL